MACESSPYLVFGDFMIQKDFASQHRFPLRWDLEGRIWLRAHMSRCVHTTLHLRSSLPSSVSFHFHPFFSQEKASASHGWEVCVKHTPQRVHSSQRSDKLTEKTFSDAWRVNSICLIFCHQRSYEFYSRHTEYERGGKLYILTTVLFALFINCCSSVASLNASSMGRNLKVKCWIVQINISRSQENDLL